jgi:hypothetical protein
MFKDGLLDSMGQRPGVISHDMGFGAKVVDHLIKVTVVADLKHHSVKFGIDFDHLVGLATQMFLHLFGKFF